MADQLRLDLDGSTPAPPVPPPDAPARDRIAHDLGATLFVEAGAGAGKTTALVGRVVALVDDGVPIESIAAITFTEKAAAELRHRLRERLAEGRRPSAHGGPRSARPRADRHPARVRPAAVVRVPDRGRPAARVRRARRAGEPAGAGRALGGPAGRVARRRHPRGRARPAGDRAGGALRMGLVRRAAGAAFDGRGLPGQLGPRRRAGRPRAAGAPRPDLARAARRRRRGGGDARAARRSPGGPRRHGRSPPRRAAGRRRRARDDPAAGGAEEGDRQAVPHWRPGELEVARGRRPRRPAPAGVRALPAGRGRVGAVARLPTARRRRHRGALRARRRASPAPAPARSSSTTCSCSPAAC